MIFENEYFESKMMNAAATRTRFLSVVGGEGRIRTYGPVTGQQRKKPARLGHSRTSPLRERGTPSRLEDERPRSQKLAARKRSWVAQRY